MHKYFKALFDIFKNYHFYSIPVLINEAIYYQKYNNAFNKFKYLSSNFLSDSIPCSYFFLKRIKKFIIKNNIKLICDLGSGYGKILYYLGVLNNYKIDGVEFEKEIYLDSLNLINNNIRIFNEDILNFNANNRYQLLVINDPLKRNADFNKLINNIKKNYSKIYLIFININSRKLDFVSQNLKIEESLIISKSRNILFCSVEQ
jgi:SAM-dependent methyltransferase